MQDSTSTTEKRGEPVPDDLTGYAVYDGALRIDGDRFELDLSVDEAAVLRKAARAHGEVPTAVAHCLTGATFRGDHSDLRAAVEVLRYYENHHARIGEDKLAYDARTAFNHANRVVRDRLGDNDDA